MRHGKRIIMWGVIAVAVLIVGVVFLLAVIVERVQSHLAVYNASNIVDQFWHYKLEHGTWPPAGEVFGYGDSHYIRSVSGTNGNRSDHYSFDRSEDIVINVAWKDDLFARLEPK